MSSPIPFPAMDASFASDQVKWRGVPFEYGDRVLIIPPLPIADISVFDKEMIEFGEAPDDAAPELKAARTQWTEQRQALMRRAITKALRRNYSAEVLSEEEINEFLTYENFFAAFSAAQGTSPKEAPRVRMAGELKPGTHPL